MFSILKSTNLEQRQGYDEFISSYLNNRSVSTGKRKPFVMTSLIYAESNELFLMFNLFILSAYCVLNPLFQAT